MTPPSASRSAPSRRSVPLPAVPLPVLVAPAAVSTLLALTPVRRPFAAATTGWALSMPAVEMPVHVGAYVGAVVAPRWARRRGGLRGRRSTSDVVGTALAALTCAGAGVLVARQLAAATVLERALAEVRGQVSVDNPGTTTTPPHSPAGSEAGPVVRPEPDQDGPASGGLASGGLARLGQWATVMLTPWPGVPRGVRARRGLTYGPDPVANRFDLYTRRGAAGGGSDGGSGSGSDPGSGAGAGSGEVRGVLVHIHGGHFRAGGPSRESRAMLFDHAARGWAAISTTYHLSPTPEAGFPQHLVDIKQLVRWIRVEGAAHGIPAGTPIVVAGSSAGAHIAMMTALTAGDPAYQPGFEEVDTRIDGVVGLYGYYGRLGAATKDTTDPGRLPATSAPPAAIIHGTLDTYTPVKGSRRLVERLRAGSPNPVMYAELPGAQHGFDAVRTPRYLAVTRAVAGFTDWVISRPSGSPASSRH